MPYKAFEEDGQFVVYKIDADEKPMGKALGTHKDKPSADKQVKALYANETKEANHQKMYDEIMVGPISFTELQQMQDAEMAALKLHEMSYQFPQMVRRIFSREDLEDKDKSLQTLADEFIQFASDALNKEASEGETEDTQKESGWFDKLVMMVKEAVLPPKPVPKPYSYIWKDNDGQYRWLAAYTNNFRDNDNPPEIISSQAHKDFDKAVNSGEWPMPEVWLWHYPYPVGQTHTHYYDEKSGFCIAGGTFDKEWAVEGILKQNWQGISHGMPKATVKRDEKDKSIIVSRRTREITFLPTHRAANQLAFHIISKESEMDDIKEIPAHKREEFVAAFGEERVKQMEAEVAQRSQQAKEEGAESKETSVPTQELSPDIANALQALVTAVNQVDETVKAIDDRVKELEKTDKEKIEKQTLAIPQASLDDLVKSQLFSTQNQIAVRPDGPAENKNKQDGSSGLFFEEMGWTKPVGRQ